MTAKEKAEQLVIRYYDITGPFTEAKQCALIAVDEILSNNLLYHSLSKNDILNNSHIEYWQEVKNEIEKL